MNESSRLGLHNELKSWCYRRVQEAIDFGERPASDGLIGTVVTLAAWEFLYRANFDVYHANMRVVWTMVEGRGGLVSLNRQGVLLALLLAAGHDLVIFIGGQPYFRDSRDDEWQKFLHFTLPSNLSDLGRRVLPPGFAKLEDSRLSSSRLLEVVRIVRPLFYEIEFFAVSQIYPIEQQLFDWTGGWIYSFCPFHTPSEDEVVQLADQCLRIGILCLVHHMMSALGLMDDFYGKRRAHTLGLAASLQFRALNSTVYGELALWSVMVIRGISGALLTQDLELLNGLASGLGILNWAGMKTLLHAFMFPENLCEGLCRTIWDTVTDFRELARLDRRLLASTSDSRYDLQVAPTAFPSMYAARPSQAKIFA